MHITVTGRHMEVTEALRDYVHGKLERELSDYPRLDTAHAILFVEKYRQIAEVVVQAPGHVRVEAKEESDDMYVSVDRAVEKVAKQLFKHRDKLLDHKARVSYAEVAKEVEGQDNKG